MTLGVETAVRQLLLAVSGIVLVERDDQVDLPVDGNGKLRAYLRYRLVEAPTRAFGLGPGAPVDRRGFVQVDVMTPRVAGEAAAKANGALVLASFKRTTVLGRARIVSPAYAASPLEASPYNQVPVTVPWRALVEEGVP